MSRLPALSLLILGLPSVAVPQSTTSPAFEVATIKPAPPQAAGRISSRMSVSPARLNFTNVSLADLICRAYGVQRDQVTGSPWLDNERFDITAKIPAGIPTGQVPLMLQGLLAERFHLVLHHEQKELPIFALVIARSGPKLRRAESSNGLSINTNNTRTRLTGNLTMAALADYLSVRLSRPVLDRTSLEGPYAITLEWTLDQADPASLDGTSAPPLFTAIQEQLGLKLDPAKGLVEILAIDRLDKLPTEN